MGICEGDHAAPLRADGLDEAPKMSQRSLDPRGVRITNLVQRLNECVRIVAQLSHNGVRLVDKLDDRTAGICAGAPDRGAGELSDPPDTLWVVWRSEVHNGWPHAAFYQFRAPATAGIECSATMGATGSRGRHVLRPVWPDIGAAVAAAGTDHAPTERPDNCFVGQVIGVHRRLMIAGDRIAIDEQMPDAEAADMAQRDRLERLLVAILHLHDMPVGEPVRSIGGHIAPRAETRNARTWHHRTRLHGIRVPSASPSNAGSLPRDRPEQLRQLGDVDSDPPRPLSRSLPLSANGGKNSRNCSARRPLIQQQHWATDRQTRGEEPYKAY
jgi:hypothetical protein